MSYIMFHHYSILFVFTSRLTITNLSHNITFIFKICTALQEEVSVGI
jgi:hypothetical protein